MKKSLNIRNNPKKVFNFQSSILNLSNLYFLIRVEPVVVGSEVTV